MIPDPVEFAAVLSSLIVLSALAVRLKAIDRAGQVAGVAISTLIYLGGGLVWVILVTSFFVVGSTFTRWRYSTKMRLGLSPEKNGVRSWPNILANGGFGATLAVLEGTLGGAAFAIAFLGSLATAAADTLATELGVMSRRNPRLVTNLGKRVAPGSSGGVTALGTGVAAVSAMLYGLAGAFLGIGDSKMLIVIASATAGGFAGALVDSVLGATIQGIYRCDNCGREVETATHHGQAAIRIRGTKVIDNNIVNLVSIVFGGLLTAGLFFLF
jgi:uncharacterized protein (TIGR00297 family)